MIKSFRGKDTQAPFEGRCPRRWQAIRRVAERKLAQLNAATTLDFLRAPPGNRLEALKGDRAGQYSIRISEQWRVCFTWSAGNVFDVEIVNYH
jgi:proteic killer suppression protein